MSRPALLALPAVLVACAIETAEPPPSPGTPAPAVPAAPSPPTSAAPTPASAATPAATPAPAGPLTPEELALIEADPKTLTVEQRRLRGFALRKKIMQNPDSPAAKSLEEVRRAVEAGELVPQLPNKPAPDSGLHLSLEQPDKPTGERPTPRPAPENAEQR